MEWTKENIQDFISHYESMPVLWDVRSHQYKDRFQKQNAWNKLASLMATDVQEVQRKAHNLRNQFSQEIKKIKNKKSGQGTLETYHSNWPYFESLKFIQSSVDPRLSCNSTVSKLMSKLMY
jgi:hypothetical protein